MAWQVGYLADDGVVRAEVSEAVSLKDLVRIFGACVVVAREHGVKRILVDACQMTIALSPVLLYGLPRLLQERGLTRRYRVAVTVSGQGKLNENLQFLETVFLNRGFSVRLFSETPQALAWLKCAAQPPNKIIPPAPRSSS